MVFFDRGGFLGQSSLGVNIPLMQHLPERTESMESEGVSPSFLPQ